MRTRRLEVPSEDQGILASLLRLSDPALQGLDLALSRARPSLEKDELISQLREEPNLADVGDLEQIVGALLSLAGTAYSTGVGLDEILDAVIAEIKRDEVVDLSESDAEILKGRLARLAKTRSVELVAKAGQLLRANDRSFQSVRVITDLRPICSGEDVKVAGAVIVHQLAIRALHNGRSETTYVALDSADLATLNSAVARALKKDRALRSFAITSDTPILTPTGE